MPVVNILLTAESTEKKTQREHRDFLFPWCTLCKSLRTQWLNIGRNNIISLLHQCIYIIHIFYI